MEESSAVISALTLFLPLCSSLDRMLHILHQDYCISPQTRCSVPVEVAVPGMLLRGQWELCLSRKSRSNLRWFQIYLAVATKTVCLFLVYSYDVFVQEAAGLHEKSGIDLVFNLKSLKKKTPGRKPCPV